MEYHQGRASKVSVDNGIAEEGLEDMDTVSEDLGFTNIHYLAAAAAYNYQYAQKDAGAFAHDPKYLIRLLYDSIEHIGGDVSGVTRP